MPERRVVTVEQAAKFGGEAGVAANRVVGKPVEASMPNPPCAGVTVPVTLDAVPVVEYTHPDALKQFTNASI